MNSRYLVYYITLVAVGFLFVAGVGAYAGPAHLISKHYEEGIADILISGSNVCSPGDYDEGTVQKYYVSKLSARKEVVVMGDSRSMLIGGHLFPGRSFFNNSVSSGRLGDYFAIYELYEQSGFIPSVVVLGLDPWMVTKSSGELRWLSLRQQYLSMSKRLNAEPSINTFNTFSVIKAEIRDLMSLPYFKKSLMNLFLKWNKVPYFSTNDRPDLFCKLYDGSISYGEGGGVSRPPDIAEAVAITWAKNSGGAAGTTRLWLVGYSHPRGLS